MATEARIHGSESSATRTWGRNTKMRMKFGSHSERCEPRLVKSGGTLTELILAGICTLALLASATARWPYSFYVLLRVLICAASIYLSSKRYQEGQTLWIWIFAAVALLFNPVLSVRMARADWRVLDLLFAGFFAGWAAYSTILATRANSR